MADKSTPPDSWQRIKDIVEIASKVATVCLAVIAFWATQQYNQRQERQQLNDQRQQTELHQVQTIIGLFDPLASTDPKKHNLAIITVKELTANLPLAIKLCLAAASQEECATTASTFGTDPLLALAREGSRGNPQVKQTAAAALDRSKPDRTAQRAAARSRLPLPLPRATRPGRPLLAQPDRAGFSSAPTPTARGPPGIWTSPAEPCLESSLARASRSERRLVRSTSGPICSMSLGMIASSMSWHRGVRSRSIALGPMREGAISSGRGCGTRYSALRRKLQLRTTETPGDPMRPGPTRTALSIALLSFALPLAGQQLQYPPAPKGTTVDNYSGHSVPDPYRGLEDPDAPATKSWVEAENKLTFGYLDRLQRRDSIRKRLTTIWDYPKVQVPLREAGQIWFRKNSGLQKQSVLYRKPSLGAAPVAVLDPNVLSPDGSTAVAQWSVSPDGKILAYTTAAGGSDLLDIHFRSLVNGKDLSEVLPRVKFTEISWTRDSKGFYYSRFRGSAERANLKDANTHHQLWYHPLGGGPERLVFERPDDSTAWAGGSVSDDGRWLYTYSGSGTTNNRLWIADLKDARRPELAAAPLPVVTAEDAFNIPLGVVGNSLYIYTNWMAPRGRVVAATIGDSARARWRTIVPESEDVINGTLLVGNRLVIAYLVDVQSRLRLFNPNGTLQREIPLPDVGTADNLSGRNGGTDFFFAFSSYLRPTTIYRYDLNTDKLQAFEPTQSRFDPSPYETRATFYQSKDGTRIPIFITARKGLARNGSHPTLLYGYGGFNANLTPFYSPAVATWLELGGVYAVPNLRGGGEYGEEWHEAGKRAKKQNVFDDFIAAAEFLVREGYATPSTLAIRGGSNGGLLVGAAMTQRPDLFGVALPAVGVMDMLRFQKFTGGQFWADEYGSSDDSTTARYLLAYSPLHNLKPGTCYPATLVTTADHDDRVVPAHSFKFAAALQAAQGCPRPVLLRVEKAGSHGYKPTDRVIAEMADVYAFALENLSGTVP